MEPCNIKQTSRDTSEGHYPNPQTAKWSGRRTAPLSSVVAIVLLAISCLSFITVIAGDEGVKTGNFITDDTYLDCQNAAAEADVNMDMKLSNDEYVDFMNIYSGDELEESTFGAMPLRFILIYHWVACFCTFEPDASTECCVGDNSNIALDDSTESQQTLFLFCAQADMAINDILGTPMPSMSLAPSHTPSNSPSLSLVPSISPSAGPSSVPSDVPTATPSVVPTSSPSTVPTPVPSVEPTVTHSPSSLPSMFIPPTQSPAPSPTPTTLLEPTLSPGPSPAPSSVPSYAPSSEPSMSPAPSQAPSALPSFSPSMVTISPTSQNLLCIRFQYSLRNEANLTADEIFNEDNNTLKERLIIATGLTVTDILNETFPLTFRVGSNGGGNLIDDDGDKGSTKPVQISDDDDHVAADTTPPPDLSHVVSVKQNSSDTTSNATLVPLQSPLLPLFGPNRRLHSPPTLTLATENAAIAAIGGDQLDFDIVQSEFEEWMVSPDHVERRLPMRRQSRSRRLVYYTDDIPATILSIADAPLLLCPGAVQTPRSRCVIVSERTCVILGPEDNESMVRVTLVQGLGDAINAGEFQDNIPPTL